MANRRRSEAKEQAWRERFERFETCGLTVRAFCEQEEIREAAFYFWRRTIAERDGSRSASGSADHVPAFVPMVVREQPIASQVMEILLAGGRVLRLPASISGERLAEVVAALEAIAPGQPQCNQWRGAQ
jgi:hypothetical protein